jgi:CheY-like chemotaxis protein
MISSIFERPLQGSGTTSLFGSGGEPPPPTPGSRQDILDRIRRKKCRVLVVDDDDLFRISVTMKLKTSYRAIVRYTKAGSDAIEIVKASAEQFDLILLDIRLIGEIDGVAVYEAIRDARIDTPVLFMSAYYSENARKKIISLGETILLKTPLDYARIEAVLLKCRGGDAS